MAQTPTHSPELAEAVAALARGEVVALPTETVYGVACDAANLEAVEGLYALKGRPAKVPLPVAIAAPGWASAWQEAADPRLERLAQRWWPGPLTVVVPAHAGVSPRITAGLGTVALRVPAQPLCTQVIAALGRAIVLTSANRHGEAPALTAEEVRAAFPTGLAAVVDGGRCEVGVPSTLVALQPEGAWRVLREGAVSEAELAAVLDT